jgi:hypothetical protein
MLSNNRLDFVPDGRDPTGSAAQKYRIDRFWIRVGSFKQSFCEASAIEY